MYIISWSYFKVLEIKGQNPIHAFFVFRFGKIPENPSGGCPQPLLAGLREICEFGQIHGVLVAPKFCNKGRDIVLFIAVSSALGIVDNTK